MVDYNKRLVEVDEILNYLSEEDLMKIPEDIRLLIKKNKDKEYTWQYDETKSLKDQNVSRDTIAFLSYLNTEYLLNEKQKQYMKQLHELNEKKIEQEKEKKYKDVLYAFKKSNNMILCAIFRSIKDGKLGLRELRTTQFDLKLIQTIIEQNGWNKDGKEEFAILDENGIVYESIGAKFNVEIDQNGYMHINDDELVVHSHKDGFVSGNTKEDVDKRYKRMVDMGFCYKDKNFGEDGFVSIKRNISSKEIAENDKKQKITTSEIGEINSITKKLIENDEIGNKRETP